MSALHRITATTLCVTAVLSPATAGAQSSEAWQFGASVYGWFPSVKGSTTFRPPPGSEGGSGITFDAADVIGDLKTVFMGSFEARKGRWGGFTDFIYMDLGDTKSRTRDLLLGPQQVASDVSADLGYDLKSAVWTLAGEYRTVAEPGSEVDTFLGARMIDVEQKVAFSLSGNIGSIALADRSGSRKANLKMAGSLSAPTGSGWSPTTPTSVPASPT